MIVYDNVVFILNISIDLFGFSKELEGVVLGLFEEDGDVFEVFFILDMVVEFVFDFALLDEFGDFVIIVDFFYLNLFGQFLEDKFLDDLFFVVLFFLHSFNGFPLVLQALNSPNIVLVE